MNYQGNQSMLTDPDFPAPQGAFPVWSKVFTKPGEASFIEITEHPDARAKSAYTWMFIAGILSGLISNLLQFVIALAGLQQAASQFGGLPGSPGLYGISGLLWAICSAPLTGLFSVIGFAISTAIVYATAKFFGGTGTFDKMAYAFGAVAAPVSIVSALMLPLNAIPMVMFCTVPAFIALSIYILYLNVAAIKAVHKLGWGESAGALLLPSILIGLLCGVAFLGLMRMAGPSVTEILQQLQQLRP